MAESENSSIKDKILSYKSFTLPEEEYVLNFIENSIHTLENEDIKIRPQNANRIPGGLIDLKSHDTDYIVVPDIHGRYSFLIELMDYIPFGKNKTVLQLVEAGELTVICMGDGVHGENRAKERWLNSFVHWTSGNHISAPMTEEMTENFATMFLIMELKNTFPLNFHFLKGNHENIMNEEGHGNYPFRKYCAEGKMCYDFIQKWYSDATLHLLDCWEKMLPVCIYTKRFAVSHAEPAEIYTRDQIINCKNYPSVIEGLTWTGNDTVMENTAKGTFKNLSCSILPVKTLWFGGHRPVYGKFCCRQNGSFYQIHNPEEKNIAYISRDKKFNPEEDIFSINKIN